jgi:hypothetical protein
MKKVVIFPVKQKSGVVIECSSYAASYAEVLKGGRPLDPRLVVKEGEDFDVVGDNEMIQEAA